jgi:uncharacterized protein DUF7002
VDVEQLVDRYPRLFHMANAGAWPTIRTHGLLPTSQIIASSGLTEEQQRVILQQRRPKSVPIDHPILGLVTIRDQAPLREQFLAQALAGMSIEQWLSILNDRVFFWLHPDRLAQLLRARLYRQQEQDVLTLDTASVVTTYGGNVRLSAINSGATLYPNAVERGPSTFLRIEEYPFDQRRKTRNDVGAIAELAVIGGVRDIVPHLIAVDRRLAGEIVKRLYP